MTTPVTEPTAEPAGEPAPAATVPTAPEPLHEDPVIAKALEGLTDAQRETLLTQGGKSALTKEKEKRRQAMEAAASAAEQAKAELAQQIGKALGIVEDETVDPAKLTEQLTAKDAEAKQARLELAIFHTASGTADANALLDSRTFMSKVSEIDPTDTAALAAAIDEAVKANPALAATSGTRLPAPNPAQGTSAAGPTTPAQLSSADVERLYAEKKYDEIEQARKEGRLNTILGVP